MKKPEARFTTTLEEVCLTVIERATKEEPIKARSIRFVYEGVSKEKIAIRRVQEAIQSLRFKGIPICANGEGYFWPNDWEDLRDYIEVFQKRVKIMCIALAALKKSYGKITINTESVIEAE